MKKAIIIGCPGAGKSTFARKLRDLTGLPLFYLDMIWHRADGSNISREDFDKRLREITIKDCWIIDGNYQRTLETRIKMCDTIFLLDFPTELCLEGVKARVGCVREDMPWVETEPDEEFGQCIADFPKNCLPRIYELLEKYGSKKNVVVFKKRDEVDDFVKGFEVN